MSKTEKSRLVRSSGWTSDLNASKSESEIESRETFVKRKKPERKKKSSDGGFETNDRRTLLRSRENLFESSFEKSTSNEHEMKESSIFGTKKKLPRSRNLKSTELEDLDRNASKAVDVVVDVHRHYEESVQSLKSQKSTEIIDSRKDELENIFSRDFKKPEGFIERKINVTRKDDPLVEESLDSIEELDGPLKYEENEDERTLTSIESNVRSLQNDFKEKPRRRKLWDTVQLPIEEATSEKKPPRKRWSKDTCVIRLPETLGDNNSPSRHKIEPIPAPRSKMLRQKSAFAFDNESFVSENEEVLRIETDHARDDTRIELRKLSDRTNNTPSSSSRNSGKNDVSSKSKKKGTSSIIENIEDSDVNGSSSSTKKVLSLLSIRSRQDSLESNLSNSLEEIASSRSHFALSGDELLTDDRRKTSKKKQSKFIQYSSRESLSTNDEVESSSRVLPCKSEGKLSKENEENDRSIPETGKIANEMKKKKKKKKRIESIKYILVTVHKADMLETDYVTKHPMVKVHVVEETTGNYLKSKRDTGNAYLQPMVTGKFDFKENRSMIPIWEEELIFEHDFQDIVKTGNERVLLFFEVVDLLSFAEASFNYDRFGNEGCWYKIAWAFLRTVGTSNVTHVDKRIRLQLYRPQKSVRNFGSRRCEVYNWWKSNKRDKYPSSLYVTVASIDPPKLEPVIYQQLSLDDILDTGYESQKLSAQSSELINLPRWTRLAAQSCKIPNEKYFETEVTENGCFFLTFSNDGKYLATILSEEYDYPIVVYELESTKIHVRFGGHKTFVYSLNWTQDDHYLLSTSSDQTARIWDVRNKIVQYVQMLPHPSYVYCGKFNLRNSLTIGTGCYDRVARIWSRDSKSKSYELNQELEGHEGFVNSLCFQKNGNLLTADSVGVVILWSMRKNRRMTSRKEWHLSKRIKVRDIEGITINAIILHPLESRLLVHSRDNGLRMIDLSAGVVLQKYDGLKNQRIQSTACISPCGSLIFCGGEDSTLNVWSLETGRYLARYTIERTFRAVTCVDYHPYDHVLAFSTFGSSAPVRILKFNKNSTGIDVGLQTMLDTETGSEDRRNVLTSSLPNVSLKERSRSMSIARQLELGEPNDFRSVRSRTSTINIFQETERSGRYENAKLKLQKLKETEDQLKSRSTSRLYNIIEKIDRILSNTSRSSNDLESGQSFVSKDQEREKSRASTDFNENNDRKEKTKTKKSRLSRNANVDRSNLYVDSSSTSYDGKEVIEMKTFHVLEENDVERRRGRSRSAKTSRSRSIFVDDTLKTFSDGMANSRKSRERRKGIVNSTEYALSSDNLNSVIVQEAQGPKIDSSSSPESAGTYVVEKADFERNDDLNSIKTLENERSVNEPNTNLMKTVGSDSSLPSNATFTIENEIPVPKPRRNKMIA